MKNMLYLGLLVLILLVLFDAINSCSTDIHPNIVSTPMPIKLRLHDPKYNIKAVHDAAKVIFINNKVLADLATAQAILESNLYGKPSHLAIDANNLFGITDTRGTAGYITMVSREYYDGGYHIVDRVFSKNLTLEDSFQQYKHLILDRPRYANIKTATSFEEAAVEIRKDGYATDPSYTLQLLNIYKKYIKPLD